MSLPPSPSPSLSLSLPLSPSLISGLDSSAPRTLTTRRYLEYMGFNVKVRKPVDVETLRDEVSLKDGSSISGQQP
jgi:hypothetical protein